MERVMGIGGLFFRATDKASPGTGCDIDDNVVEGEYGKFGWVMDPEGNRTELWEPPGAPAG
ncbi:MAG: hypothetical protein QGG40_08795 [Myxococcota bacterium]|nr:hypothetical protein [Myxococcota bacterium]